MIDSLREYKTIMEHAPRIITAAISINARGFSLSRVYETLFA